MIPVAIRNPLPIAFRRIKHFMVDKQKETKIGHLLTALRMANEIVFGEKKLWRRK